MDFGIAMSEPTHPTEQPRELEAKPTARSVGPREARTVRSDEILQGADEVQIDHEGQVYRLRRTRSGKLILHK
jgi:hemin uptake protein HemP